MRLVVVLLTGLCLTSAFLTKSLNKRKSKGRSGWSENWESWSDDAADSCSCDCKKKQETVAIVIPKYQFVDIPTAKEVPSEDLVTPHKVQLSAYGGNDHPDFDEDDEHNHRILESEDLKRRVSHRTKSHRSIA